MKSVPPLTVRLTSLTIESNTPNGYKADKQGQMTAVPIYVQNWPECVIKKPTALEFNRDYLLHAIFQMNVESNGITITASILSSQLPKVDLWNCSDG